MWKKLIGLGGSTREARRYRLPEGRRLYAIGDVHGRRDLLDQLLRRIDACDHDRQAAASALLFVGDLIDRGPDSRGVVERVMQLAHAGKVAALLMGNHEEILIRAAEGDLKAAGLFARIGGRETMLSYGVDETTWNRAEVEALPTLIADHVPQAHLDFLRGAQDVHSAGDYLFVHAGIRPNIAIEEQQSRDLRWIRGEFLTYRGEHGQLVIHGHTITDEVDEQPNRIGIDTGAYATGRLTAIGLEGDQRWYLTATAA